MNKTKKETNLIYFDNADVFHEFIHIELSFFCTFDAVNAINICSKY